MKEEISFDNWKNPNELVVKQFANAFDICFDRGEKELVSLFQSDSQITESLISDRVRGLNALYHTFLWEENIKDIVSFLTYTGGSKFENRIHSGDLNVVKELADRKGRKCFVFATKYCSFANPKNYPIYDSLVGNVLTYFHTQESFIDGELNFEKIRQDCNYIAYKDIVDDFMNRFGLQNCSYRDVDKYLWLVGKNTRFEKGTEI